LDLLGGQVAAATREKYTNWSLDHQLEFCECSALADVFTGSRDTEGVERVVEALGSHTWSGYTKKLSTAALLTPPHVDAAGAAGTRAHAEQEESCAGAGERAFDTSKWDKYVAAQPDPEADLLARTELSKVRLEKVAYDGEIDVDDDVLALVEHAHLSDDEVEVVSQLLDATQRPDLESDRFFCDPAALASYIPGPNSAIHLNLDSILPGVSKVVQGLVQIYKECPAASRMLVRSAIWCNMVDAGAGGGGGGGGGPKRAKRHQKKRHIGKHNID